ncbi:hypothetical protein CFSAN001627_24821, partial [Clostridium botulinum CFSAN001627]
SSFPFHCIKGANAARLYFIHKIKSAPIAFANPSKTWWREHLCNQKIKSMATPYFYPKFDCR